MSYEGKYFPPAAATFPPAVATFPPAVATFPAALKKQKLLKFLHDNFPQKIKKTISVIGEKDLSKNLGQLSTIFPLGLRPRGSKNSSFPRFWRVHFPAYDGNIYSSLVMTFLMDTKWRGTTVYTM